jgi:hypothetical protein
MNVLNEKVSDSYLDQMLVLEPQMPVNLYCLVAGNEISAALFSPKKNIFLGLESMRTDGIDAVASWKKYWEEKDLARFAGIVSSHISVVNSEHTLVPANYFRPEDAEEIFHLNFTRKEGTIVQSQKIQCMDAWLLYRSNPSLPEAIRASVKSPVFHHHLAALTESFFLRHKNDAGTLLLVHLRRDAMDIVVKSARRILLVNSFSWKTPEDILYRVLNVYEQLQLNPEQEKLFLSGNAIKGAPAVALLQQYIRHVDFMDRPPVASYSNVLDGLAPEQYYSLFSQVLCG